MFLCFMIFCKLYYNNFKWKKYTLTLLINIQLHVACYLKKISNYSYSQNNLVMYPEYLGISMFKCKKRRTNLSRKIIINWGMSRVFLREIRVMQCNIIIQWILLFPIITLTLRCPIQFILFLKSRALSSLVKEKFWNELPPFGQFEKSEVY